MTRIGAIIQARLDSTRLCHKVFRRIGNGTVLGHVIDAAVAATLVDVVAVATPDWAIAEYASLWFHHPRKTVHSQIWPGPRDCLAEYHTAAQTWKMDLVVRLTADCPMLTGEIIDAAIDAFVGPHDLKYALDYLYNGTDGADVEVFTFDALDRAYRYATAPEEREHVGLWIKRNLLYKELPPMPGPWKSLDNAEDYAYICRWFENHPT